MTILAPLVLLIAGCSLVLLSFKSAEGAGALCPQHGQVQLDSVSKMPVKCNGIRGCNAGYSCVLPTNGKGFYVCCRPSTRALSNNPHCGSKGFNYYSFNEPTKPLECKPNVAGACPPAYKCLPADNLNDFPNTNVCCLLQNNGNTGNRDSSADCPPVNPTSTSGGGQVLCKNLAIPHHDVFGLEDTKCSKNTVFCGPEGPVYECEDNPNDVKNRLCCPVYGTCPNGDAPETYPNKRVITCDIRDQSKVCGPDRSCQTSSAGWIVCCPDHGQCPGSTRPYYEPNDKLPKICTAVGTTSDCPKSPQEYQCMKGTKNTNLCCPVLGDCLPGFKPFPSKSTPKNCTIPRDFGMKTGCPDKPDGIVCHVSTTGHNICCQDLDFNDN